MCVCVGGGGGAEREREGGGGRVSSSDLRETCPGTELIPARSAHHVLGNCSPTSGAAPTGYNYLYNSQWFTYDSLRGHLVDSGGHSYLKVTQREGG